MKQLLIALMSIALCAPCHAATYNEDKDGLYRANVTIGKSTLSCLIDTGTNTAISIGKNDAVLSGITSHNKPVTIPSATANGIAYSDVYFNQEITIFGHKIHDVQVFVNHDSAQCIVGTPVIDNFTTTIGHGLMTVTGE